MILSYISLIRPLMMTICVCARPAVGTECRIIWYGFGFNTHDRMQSTQKHTHTHTHKLNNKQSYVMFDQDRK